MHVSQLREALAREARERFVTSSDPAAPSKGQQRVSKTLQEDMGLRVQVGLGGRREVGRGVVASSLSWSGLNFVDKKETVAGLCLWQLSMM